MTYRMKTANYSLRIYVLLAVVLVFGLVGGPGRGETVSSAATFTVTNSLNTGAGSFRQAILDANANPGADTIQFTIGTGALKIKSDTTTPTVTEAVIIDGSTQPGFVGTPLIILNRQNASTSANGLRVTGGGTTIKAIAILRFNNGISLETAGGNIVTGCFIGIDPRDETLTTTNNISEGVLINNSPNNRIGGSTTGERNVIGRSSSDGVEISGSASTGNVITGNYIGLRSNGTDLAANSASGVLIDGAANNRVGGSAAGERNVIAGHTTFLQAGVLLNGSAATGNTVQGNYIGTDATGALERGNADGVRIANAPNNNIGGTAGTTPGGGCTGACNLISGNRSNGINIPTGSGTASGNIIEGNFFNLNPAGTSLVTATTLNSSISINSSSNNRVGGSTPAARNVIVNNSSNNIAMTGPSSNNVVTGNYIGTNAAGTAAIGNATNGVLLNSSPTNNRIGGTIAGERNVISGGNQVGAFLGTGGNNIVQGNYIGTDATGTQDLGNSFDGVLIVGGTNNTIGTATGTTLGGACTGGCNLISGNNRDGVRIVNFASVGNRVDYNYIGLNAAGTTALRNGVNAVNLFGTQNNIIGKPLGAPFQAKRDFETVPEAILCIQEERHGRYLSFSDITGDFTLKDCRTGFFEIGRGELARTNTELLLLHGQFRAEVNLDRRGFVNIYGRSGYDSQIFDSDVGDSTCMCPTEGLQTIVGELRLGIDAANAANNNVINGNSVGEDAKGLNNLANNTETGILVQQGSGNVLSDNIIASQNNLKSISIALGTGNDVRAIEKTFLDQQPSIDLRLPLDLNNNGIHDPNDPLDLDGGANNTQNYPESLKALGIANGGVRVTGTLNSLPNGTFLVNLYTIHGSTVADQQGGGTRFSLNGINLSTPLELSTDGNGNSTIDRIFTGVDAAQIESGDYLSATATVITRAANAGDTSELSLPTKVPHGIIDFDNDGKTEISVYRPGAAPNDLSNWYILNSNDFTFRQVQFGNGGDKSVAGDYQGDGVSDFAVFRPSNGTWYFSRITGDPSTNFTGIQWGVSTDIPVPGDYDDDGANDAAVFRPSEGNWWIRSSIDGSFRVQNFGLATDKLVPADYDGDGDTDIAVYRNGTWYISVCPVCPVRYERFGLASDIPVPADYDGDGPADIAVWRPSEGVWYLQQSTAGFRAARFGISTDKVLNGDFDADGKNDLAIWRPSTGDWWVLRSSDSNVTAVHWGQPGDVPIPLFPNQ